MSEPVMQSTLILDNLLDHPRCSTAAHYEYDVLSGRCPSVPERFQFRKKTRARGIHPGQFVNEHYLSGAVVYTLKMHLQHIEGFEPRSGLVTLLHALTEQRVIEMLQLVFEHILFAVVINRRESGMTES